MASSAWHRQALANKASICTRKLSEVSLFLQHIAVAAWGTICLLCFRTCCFGFHERVALWSSFWNNRYPPSICRDLMASHIARRKKSSLLQSMWRFVIKNNGQTFPKGSFIGAEVFLENSTLDALCRFKHSRKSALKLQTSTQLQRSLCVTSSPLYVVIALKRCFQACGLLRLVTLHALYAVPQSGRCWYCCLFDAACILHASPEVFGSSSPVHSFSTGLQSLTLQSVSMNQLVGFAPSSLNLLVV